MAAETARAMADEYRRGRDRLSAELAAFIAAGERHGAGEIADAWAVVARSRRWIEAAVAPGELVLTFSTPGEAPAGLAATGNAIFNRLWTLMHAACLHLPTGSGPAGLPLGVQLVDPRGREAAMLDAATWLAGPLGAASLEVREGERLR
jgi:amidase